MKKLLQCFLLFVLVAQAVYSQRSSDKTAQSAAVESLKAKQQSETLVKRRLVRVMSTVGVMVMDRDLLTSIQSYQELTLHFSQPIKDNLSSEETRSQEFETSVLETQKRTGPLARQRSFELSSDHLLIATITKDNRLRWWTLIPDPRLLRAERPGATGQLTGEVIFQRQIDFILNIPDDNEASEVRLYHPRWNGEDFVPVLLSTVKLRKN